MIINNLILFTLLLVHRPVGTAAAHHLDIPETTLWEIDLVNHVLFIKVLQFKETGNNRPLCCRFLVLKKIDEIGGLFGLPTCYHVIPQDLQQDVSQQMKIFKMFERFRCSTKSAFFCIGVHLLKATRRWFFIKWERIILVTIRVASGGVNAGPPHPDIEKTVTENLCYLSLVHHSTEIIFLPCATEVIYSEGRLFRGQKH